MWDRTGENQVYVRQQKAAEEQLRFDKTEKPSCLALLDVRETSKRAFMVDCGARPPKAEAAPTLTKSATPYYKTEEKSYPPTIRKTYVILIPVASWEHR